MKSVVRQTHATALEKYYFVTQRMGRSCTNVLQASADNSYSPTIGCAGRSVHIMHTCIIGCVF